MQRRTKRSDVRSIKSWLISYRELERDIDNQIERLEHMEAKMYSVSSPGFDDTGGGHGGYQEDKMAMMVAKKERQKAKILKMIDRQQEEHDKIEGYLEKMRDPDERAVIEMRYLDGEAWWNVTEMLFGSKTDYDDKKESYLRRTTKLHGRALCTMLEIKNEEKII